MAQGSSLSIGELSRETACKVQTIRYYEQVGLLRTPGRTEGNQRRYDQNALMRLGFIRHARELGFSLDAIRELLALSDNPDHSCDAADVIARNQLREIESRIQRLNALKRELKRMVQECAGGQIAQCRVIEVLADHSQCLTRNHVPTP